MVHETTQLVVLAKYWRPGAVKTRLAADLGAEQAAGLYREFLRTILVRFREIAEHRILAVTPESRLGEFDRFATAQAGHESWHITPQGAGDLGQRMRRLFVQAFASGAERVVLLGSDSPNLPCEIIQRAFEMLEEKSVVLGPTADGGYYLVGAREKTPDIFNRVSWSTSTVWSDTVLRLKQAGTLFGESPIWYDVDDLASLRRLARDLERNGPDESLVRLRRKIADCLKDV